MDRGSHPVAREGDRDVHATKCRATLDDRAWHVLLERYDEVALQEIVRCAGLLVKRTGDGLLARFGSPAHALDCATHLRDALAALDIQIRAGIHTGECEIADDDIVGVAVSIAARIEAAAAPGEVLVSSTVKDLTAVQATGSRLVASTGSRAWRSRGACGRYAEKLGMTVRIVFPSASGKAG